MEGVEEGVALIPFSEGSELRWVAEGTREVSEQEEDFHLSYREI